MKSSHLRFVFITVTEESLDVNNWVEEFSSECRSRPSSCLFAGRLYMAFRGNWASPGRKNRLTARVCISFIPSLFDLHCSIHSFTVSYEPQTCNMKTRRQYFGNLMFNPLITTFKPQSNGPSYSNTVTGTPAVDGWVVTFGTARRGLGRAPASPGPSSLYQM